MEAVKIAKTTSLGMCLIVLFLVITQTDAQAKTYYIAPHGSDSDDGLNGSPWATFDHAMTVLRPGDTLILKDGVYRQSLYIPISGTSENPITFKAENDGEAIVDGEGQRRPLYMDGRNVSEGKVHDIVVEGIRFENSSCAVLSIIHTNRIVIRRVSGYNAGAGNCHVFSTSHSTNLLFENCIASGFGRVMYEALRCQNVTFRRCWGRWQGRLDYSDGKPLVWMQVYGSSDCIVENCIGVLDPSVKKKVQGVAIWANTDQFADRNKILGNIMMDFSTTSFGTNSANNPMVGNRFTDNVSIDNQRGFFQRSDSDLHVRRMTVVGSSEYALRLDPSSKYLDFTVKGDVRNSVIIDSPIGILWSGRGKSSLQNNFNNLYNVKDNYSGKASKGSGEINVDPRFNVSKYGKGGYLFLPGNSPVKKAGEDGTQMGAEVLYRYQDGRLTDQPLWPWPMEDRILRETGVSATWEAKGGLWKTLDGVYSENPVDSEAPSPPNGLKVSQEN